MINRERASITRGGLLNLQTQELLTFFMNPAELSMSVTVNWTKQQALGASYERMHYRGTSNAALPLELMFNRIIYADEARTMPPSTNENAGNDLSASDLNDIAKGFERYRKFLLALAYPAGNPRDVLRRSPPHAMLIWPRTMAIRVVLTSLTIKDTQFANDGAPMAFNASCAFEEFRTYRLTSSEVNAIGMIRRAGAGRAGAS